MNTCQFNSNYANIRILLELAGNAKTAETMIFVMAARLLDSTTTRLIILSVQWLHRLQPQASITALLIVDLVSVIDEVCACMVQLLVTFAIHLLVELVTNAKIVLVFFIFLFVSQPVDCQLLLISLKCTIDFDLCEQCIVLADSQHPGHTFEVFQRGCRRSSQYQRPPVASEHDTCHHSGVRCDGCEKWIYGVRYKVHCMKYSDSKAENRINNCFFLFKCGNCADFDFCSKCEASANHDPKHVFLKIKRPVNGPIFSNVPLLPNLYAFTPPAHAPPAAQTPQMRQKETSASNTAFGVFPRNAG